MYTVFLSQSVGRGQEAIRYNLLDGAAQRLVARDMARALRYPGVGVRVPLRVPLRAP